MGLANITYEETTTLITVVCCNCGVLFGMPQSLNNKLREDSSRYFYCPNGHNQHYPGYTLSKAEYENKLREANNKLANISSEKIQLESQLNKSKKDLNKSKYDLGRLKNGVCPCCNRSFKGLHEHIKKQHPEFFK